jgi:polysaccharide deacetylase family protein (PEP-CTERM system associated)
MLHHFTVDLEEYFQVSALEPYVDRADWDRLPGRVEVGTSRLLALLAAHNTRATFFCLSWVAGRHPGLIRRIAAAGHEIASHGTDHRRVTELTPDEFRESVRDSKRILEDLAGAPVSGYRAPSFSIVPGREWALEILVEEGYRYDSSLFPVRRNGYGYPGASRVPHVRETRSGAILELPPATVVRFGRVWPAAGGGYLRLLPFGLVRAGMRDAETDGRPGMFYIHPWELDPEQPRIAVDLRTRIRHYGGLRRTEGRVARLLREFRFGRVGEYAVPRVEASR